MLIDIDVKQKKKDITSNVDKFKRQLAMANEELKLIYSQKIKDLMKETNSEYRQIIEDSYGSMELEKKSKISELNQRITEFMAIEPVDIKNMVTTCIDVIDKVLKSPSPEKKLLEVVIDKIYLLKDRSVDFKLRADTFILYNE